MTCAIYKPQSEMNDALRACSNNSAPGPDHITWKHLKVLVADPDVSRVLLALANACLRVGHWPKTFKQSLSVIIPKPAKPSYAAPKAYRPIVLLNTLGLMVSTWISFTPTRLGVFISALLKTLVFSLPIMSAQAGLGVSRRVWSRLTLLNSFLV